MEGKLKVSRTRPPRPARPPPGVGLQTKDGWMRVAEAPWRSRPTQRIVIESRLTSIRIRWIDKLLEAISVLHRAGCSVAECSPENCHDNLSERQWTALCMA